MDEKTRIEKEANELSRKLLDVFESGELETFVVIRAMQFFTIRVLMGAKYSNAEVKEIYLDAYETYLENLDKFNSRKDEI
jgi:hypothetical protein